MNVVDLCSWGIGAFDSDESLLLRVKEHYLPELPAVRAWRADDEGPFTTQQMDHHYAEARARLFPKATGRALTEADADELIKSFERQIWPLREDRNKNKAHAHEHQTRSAAKRLDPAEVRALYGYARKVLNDLCLVAYGGQWAESDVNSNNVKRTAEDLLDIVFLPNWFRRETAGNMSRVEIYDALHADTGPGHFNDKAKLAALTELRSHR